MNTSIRVGLCILTAPVLLISTLPAVSTTSAGEQPTASHSAVSPQIAFEKFTLSNGLDVILHVDRKLPVVHVSQVFHVGSKDEQVRRTGFAHLFEHMMFQGSANAPDEYFSYIGKAGANLFAGGVNGTTDGDRTIYYATVPSASLEYLLWLEADRLATLPEALTQQKLDNQREVVRNERRQSFENQPYGSAYSLIQENLYPSGHPYSWFVIGSHEDLIAASLDDVRAFFRNYYVPNNLSLVVAGDFDPAEARRFVEKYFGGIAPGPAIKRARRWVPQLAGEKVVEVSDRVPQARLYIAWPSPPLFESGDAELQLAAGVLTSGLASRLEKTLVYDRQLASDVSASQLPSEIAGAFTISATARPGADLAEIERTISDEIARLAKDGPTAAELARAKTRIEYSFVAGLEDLTMKAIRLNTYNTYLGDPGAFERDLARFRHASAIGVRDTVQRWLNTRNRLLVRYHPESAERAAAVVVDRSQPPAIGADKPFTVPDVKTGKLANGLEIFVVERPELPKVAVTLVTRAGAIADPAGRAGLASLTATTVDLGTPARKALEIETALADLGAALGSSTGRESTQLSLDVLKRNLSRALPIFADVALHPTFPETEIAREKKSYRDRLAQQASNANAVTGRVGSMLLFGREHPYGRPVSGSSASIEPIGRTDLASFHDTWWKPASSALIFSGDITFDEAKQLAEQHFGSWSGTAPVVNIPAPQPLAPGRVFVVDRPGAAQTQVAQLLPGPPRSSPDYYALDLANVTWGGGLESRLMLNLREDKGYTYGIFSSASLYSAGGAWIVSGGVQTDKTRESIVELNTELAKIAGRQPITEQELTWAKTNRVRGYAQEFRTANRVAAYIAALWTLRLPMSELQNSPQQSERTTTADVNRVAQKYAKADQATLLLVGDLAKIGPGLQQLGVGEITVLDAEGNPISPRHESPQL